MNKNYHFNVNLDCFAYLTGRSLATFKRDFEKIFGITPGKWLMQKRLQEARYLKEEIWPPIFIWISVSRIFHIFRLLLKNNMGWLPVK